LDDYAIPDALPGWIADHIRLYLDDPEKAHYWDAILGGGTGMLPTLLLVTTGRKSGAKRPLPLIYREVDGNYVIIASKGGARAHPAWYLNLVGQPADSGGGAGTRALTPVSGGYSRSTNTCSLASHMHERGKSMNVLSSSMARRLASRRSGVLTCSCARSSHSSAWPM
jgi:hypothetical protein